MSTTKPVDSRIDTATQGTVILAEELHKYFELSETRVPALPGVSMGIQRGEFLAIMGPAGAGNPRS